MSPSNNDEQEDEERVCAELIAMIEATRAEVAELRTKAALAYSETQAQQEAAYRVCKFVDLEHLREKVRFAENEMKEEEEAERRDIDALMSNEDIIHDMRTCRELMSNSAEIEIRMKKVEMEAMKLQFLLEARQVKLINELQLIYPIERISSDKEKDRHAIRGIELVTPGDGSPGRDDEQISTALGYIVHLVLLLSKYLEIPLRYQLLFYASRSIIRDPVQRDPKEQNLPLYRKDVEPERFKRAFNWLAKDVEQICTTMNVPYEWNRDILCNLQNLFNRYT